MRIFKTLLWVLSGILIGALLIPASLRQHLLMLGNTPTPAAPPTTDAQPLYWVAPMDPNYKRDKPGKSPMGMDLVPVYADPVKTADSKAPAASDGGIRIDPGVTHNLGLRTAKVTRAPLTLPIRAVGYVNFDERRQQRIQTRVEGWIETLQVENEGALVRKGQTLFEFYSLPLINAQEDFLAALRSNSQPVQLAVRERLLALGMPASVLAQLQATRKPQRRMPVFAQADGVVSELAVRQGSFITPGTQAMTISGLDTVWVMAEVFARHAPWLHEGQSVAVRFPDLPGQVWSGRLDYIYPTLNERSRSVRARILLDNPKQRLRPGMLADLTLQVALGEQLSVPREALIRTGTHVRVVLQTAADYFRPQGVVVGIEAGDRVQILSGLSRGDTVVTAGQFLIDSASDVETALANLVQQPPASQDGHPADRPKQDATPAPEPTEPAHEAPGHEGMEGMDMNMEMSP